MKNKIYFFVGASFVMLAGVGFGFIFKNSKSKSEKAICLAQEMRPVPAVTARCSKNCNIRTFPGKTRANKRVKLGFSVPGKLTELNAQEGRTVKKGEILARLDQRDYKQQLEVAKATYNEEKKSFERIRILWKKKVVSSQKYDSALAQYNIAKAELIMRHKAYEDTVLKAPFDGVIARRFAENHEHIKDKSPILLLQDISRIEVVIQVPERLMAEFGVYGLKKIQVHFDVENYCWLDASIRELSIQSDTSSRTYDVIVSLSPPKGLKILPGMTASVKFETIPHNEKLRDITLIPIEAVWSDSNNKSYVWVIPDKGGLPQKTQVTLGKMRNDGIEILSGLTPGKTVAVSGIHSLRENAPVRAMSKCKWGLDG